MLVHTSVVTRCAPWQALNGLRKVFTQSGLFTPAIFGSIS
jgi:hypothetical protein